MRPATNSYLAIHCTPSMLTGTILSRGSNDRFKIYRTVLKPLTHCEIEALILFNPTAIAQQIKEWYHGISSISPLLISLAGPAITEKLLALPTTHPTIDQFPIQHAPDWYWQRSYLYSIDSMHYFYVIGIRRPTLFQYQLMALTHQFPLRMITSGSMALLSLYKHKAGTTFRSSQLADHLMRARSIERLFTTEDIERLAQLPAGMTITKEQTVALLTACGLLTGEQYAHY